MDLYYSWLQAILFILSSRIFSVASTTVSPTEYTAPAFNNSDCLSPEDCLQKDLFLNYNTLLRPVLDPHAPVNINVTLVLNSLMDIAELDGTMSIVGFLRCVWYDEFLTWNSTEYGGVDHIILPAERIWLPDIAISNSAYNFYDITHKRDFHVEIKSDGLIRWAFGGIFTASCDLDLEKYPFDEQKCSLEIENWMYVLQDVSLNLNEDAKVQVTGLEPHGVWYFDRFEAERSIKYESFVSLKFTLIWKRKTLYYYVNIVIPIVLMILVTFGVFWLPADCGEKISLAITILLSFSVFQIIVMDNTPVNSEVVPALTSIVMLVSVLATVTLLTSMLVVFISSKSPHTRPPQWLRKLCFQYLAKALFMKSGIPEFQSEYGATATFKGKSGNKSEEQNIENKPTKKHSSWMDHFSRICTKVSPDTIVSTITAQSVNNRPDSRPESIPDTTFNSMDSENDKQQKYIIKDVLLSVYQIRKLMEDKEYSNSISDEWKFVAKVLDRCMFWITSIVFLISFLYLFFQNY